MPATGPDGMPPGPDDEPSDVTRLLSAAAHVRAGPGSARRPAQAAPTSSPVSAPDWLMPWRGSRDKEHKPHEDEGEREQAAQRQAQPPVLGFDYARWVREAIVGLRWPVPSHGFDLGAVFAHCVRSEQLRRERAQLIALALLVGGLWGWQVSAGWSPAVALVGVWLAFYADRMRALRALREAVDLGQAPASTPVPLSARDRYSVDRIRNLEGQPVIPYQGQPRTGQLRHHFVGAGKVWSESSVGIDVMPARGNEPEDDSPGSPTAPERLLPSVEQLLAGRRPGGGIKAFTPDDLLDHVRQELLRAIAPLAHFHPDSRQDVFGIATLSADRWPALDRKQWWGLVHLAHDGVQAPRARRAPKIARRFLCARMVSWDGELVACVFVGVAYENHFLRVIVRPQVLNPLDPRIREVIEGQMQLHGWAAHSSAMALAARDVGWALLRPFRGGQVPAVPAGTAGSKVVSLREAYSVAFMDDMLQNDDARRYIAMMSGRVFASVEGFLMDHNVDTVGYRNQVTVLLNQGIISGGDVVNSPVQSGNTNSTITK